MEILCTNGLKSVMTELAPTLRRPSGSEVALTWGSTVALAKEIAAGASGDIAILTREAIDDLVADGKAVTGSRVDLARSGIGVAVRKGARKPDISSPDALRHALLAANTVAHSKTGQSGIYFPTVLERLGISEQMKPKLVVPEGGVPIGEIVASGGAEITATVACCRMGAIWSMGTSWRLTLSCPTSAMTVPWMSRILMVPVFCPMLLRAGRVRAA